MKRKIFAWEPWFFMAFGLFHLHRIWGLIDRRAYAAFWMDKMENRDFFYYALSGILAGLCVLGISTFVKNRKHGFWWRWIYLFGGIYLLFDLFAVAVHVPFWNELLLWMFDVSSAYWNLIWSVFILIGCFSFLLGIKLFMDRKS